MRTPSHRYKDAQGTLYINNSVTYDYAPVYAAAYIIQYSPILLCPSQDGNTNYTSAAGRSYTIVCAGYYDGGVDTGFTAASTLLNCILLCEGRSGCTGVVWTYGNEAETADPSRTSLYRVLLPPLPHRPICPSTRPARLLGQLSPEPQRPEPQPCGLVRIPRGLQFDPRRRQH